MAYYADIITDQTGKTKCVLCNTFIPDSDNCIEVHLNDKDHGELYIRRLMIQNNIKMKDNLIQCSLCLCDTWTDITTIFDHILSLKHKNIIGAIREIVKLEGGLLLLPETATNLDSSVNCLACNRNIEFNLKAIKSHIESERHQRARSIAVQPLNAIFSVEGSKDDLWCKICQVYFQNYVELIIHHVDKDRKHTTEYNKIHLLIKDQNICIEKFLHNPTEDKAMCKKCQIEVPCNLDNLRSHITGKKHKS